MDLSEGIRVLNMLAANGLELDLRPDGGLRVAPASLLTPEIRAAIVGCRDALAWLVDPESGYSDAVGPAKKEGAEVPVSGAWPDGEAMSEDEIARLKGLIIRAMELGLKMDLADRVADRVIFRDREGLDDRRSCIECRHVRSGPRCANGRLAGLNRVRSLVEVAPALVAQLQRCEGFGHPDTAKLALGGREG